MRNFLLLSFLVALAAIPSSLLARPATKNPGLVPIFDVKYGYLLGGSRGRKWLEAKNTAGAMKSGDLYRVYSSSRELGKGKSTTPKSEGAPCPDTLFSKISPDFSAQNAQFSLGGTHNPLPRAPRSENTNQESYRKVVAGILKSRGIARPMVQIDQLWRVDLDGDGKQEVLLSATRKVKYGDPRSIGPESRAGDYSLILLRKIVSGKVKNILLEGEFYPRAKKFNAPSFYQLAAIFDANGDGKMEVLIHGQYYEGVWTTLHEVHHEKPQKVLSEGCGA